MSYRTRTESIGPKLRYSRNDLVTTSFVMEGESSSVTCCISQELQG